MLKRHRVRGLAGFGVVGLAVCMVIAIVLIVDTRDRHLYWEDHGSSVSWSSFGISWDIWWERDERWMAAPSAFPNLAGEDSITVIKVGWPLKYLSASYINHQVRVPGTLMIMPDSMVPGSIIECIPRLRPTIAMWFCVPAYGLVLWSMWFGVRRGIAYLRSQLRRARGRCKYCGYELGQLLQCPECGRNSIEG